MIRSQGGHGLLRCSGCFLRWFNKVGKFRDGMIDDDFSARFVAGLTRTKGTVDGLRRIAGSHEDIDVFGLSVCRRSIKGRKKTTLFPSKFGLAFME